MVGRKNYLFFLFVLYLKKKFFYYFLVIFVFEERYFKMNLDYFRDKLLKFLF